MGALQDGWRAGVDLYNAGHGDQIADRYADDGVWISPNGQWAGREAIRERLRAEHATFPSAQLKTTRCTEVVDTLVVEYEFAATHNGPLPMPDGSQLPPTGRDVTFPAVSVFTYADGRIAEHRSYFDRLSILMQLGLLPAP